MEWVLLIVLILFFLATTARITLSFSKNVQGFANLSEVVNISDTAGVLTNPVSVLPAQPATLTTRTNNTSGTLTMTNSSHGIVTGQRVDLYWAGGQCYGAVVGTVSGTSVPIASVSGGSVLPSTSTAISVGICQSCAFEVTGANVSGLVCSSPQQGYFVFNTGSADIAARLVAANGVYTWKTGDADANPIVGGNPTVVWVSHSNQATANTGMQTAAIYH